jgi:hypothetical protein
MQKRVGARAMLALAIAATSAGVAAAHGIVGQRSFIEPFVTEDVNPKNEFVIARPEYDWAAEQKVLHYGFGLEKKLSDDLSLTLDSEWLDISSPGAEEPQVAEEPKEDVQADASGFGNLGVTAKYSFLRSEPHEAIMSFAVEAEIPTGSEHVGAERFVALRPFFLYGKGFGDLPDGLEWLRPFAVQGDFGPEVSTDHETTTAFVHDIALEYSIPYLQSSVKDVGLRWPLANLIPVVEFNFEHGLKGEESGTMSALVTSGMVYMDRWVEIGAAGRFALNDTAREQVDPGIIFIVDLFIDDIFPWTRWQPFGGSS